MPKQVSFDEIGGRAAAMEERRANGGGAKTNYMKLDKQVKFRPIGEVIEFTKFFVERKDGKSRSVIVEEEDRDKATEMLSAHAGVEVKPQNRFAMNVIDRADGQVKILEGGLTIFGVMAQWKNANEIHPGSKNGHDWQITPAGMGKNRKYTVVAGKQTPITKEEGTKLKEKNGTYCLTEIFTSTPIDRLLDVAFGDGSGSSESSAETATDAPEGDGNFAW